MTVTGNSPKPIVVLSLLVLLTALAYGLTLRNEFVYDDTTLIAQNKLFQRLDAIPQLFVTDWWKGVGHELGRDPSQEAGQPSTGDRRYRPLAALTYVVNYVLIGPAPWGYHVINLVLHAGVSYLLYALAVALGWTSGAALIAAALFAVHPLHTEAVAWVVSRPELLMALGVLGGLWCEVRGSRRGALAAFGLGLLSKEQAVVLPVLLLLMDLCFKARPSPTVPSAGPTLFPPIPSNRAHRTAYVVRRYGPYMVVLVAYLTLRTVVMGGIQPPAYPFLRNPLEYAEGWVWGLSVVKLAGQYLWLSVWPATLSVDYSYNAIPLATGVGEAGVLWGVGAWGGLLALGVWGWRRDRRLTWAVGLTGVTFAPVANVLISVGTPLAERVFYLPLGGLCLLVGIAYERLAVRNDVRRTTYDAPRTFVTVLIGLVCLALTVRTIVRVQDWRSNETLFTSAIAAVPGNAKVHAVVGDEYMKRRDAESLRQALVEYRKALDLYPNYLTTHAGLAMNFGSVLVDLGYLPEALEAMRLAADVSPKWGRTHYNLGLVYAKLKQYREAEEEWKRAVELQPDDPQIHSTVSRFLLERGRYAEGLEAADTALALKPGFVPALFNRALALEALGRLPEALGGFERVMRETEAPPAARQDAERRMDEIRARLTPKQTPTRTCIPGAGLCR